ncbi:MAG: hypothetical protein IT258_10470, partial [Saprospiraceae bacterium]|nr:hypothetical protein [Saprospiraceae bacterium]
MIRLFPARAFYVIILMVIGWSNVVFAQVANNYCVPSLVKENIFFEKLQIGTWIPGLTAGSKVESISVNTFGDADQNYEFSLQGMPQTRDTFYWQIWIDINQDNDFEDGGERFLSTYTSRKQKALGKIHFPNTIRGQYLVRIMLSRSKANNACGTHSKTLDYLDFWLKGSCPAPKPLEQVKVADSTQESILLRFNWPKNTKFNWVLSGKEGVSYSKYGSEVGDSLLIKYLYFENSYQFRYQLQCGELIWSDWSDPVDVGTVYKPTCSQIDINQVKIDEVGFDHVTITVPKQENSEVYWYSISSYEGKGDTVFGSSSYGQSKIPLSLAGAKYHLSVKKACLNDYDSEWTFENLTFTKLPDPCASVFLKINRLGANSFAQAFPTQRIAYEWRLRLKGNAEWQVSESTSDTLSLSTLDSSSVYEIQVRVKCTPDSWSEWSILQKFSLINSCPKPQLADIKYEQEGMVFKLSYQGTCYRQVIWNEPPASSYLCGPAKDSTKPELTLWLKYGEKLYVRLKGICKENNEQSDYSDTLWLERPCVAPGLTDFNAVNISDKTMDFLVNAEFCGDYDYMFSQDSLLPNSDWKSFSYRKYPHGNFKELQPGTKYFIKIRRQCYDQEGQSVYSPIKSFVTLNQPKVCQAKAIPKNDIKIEFAEPSTVIIRIKPQSANSHYRVFMTKYDEYVGYFYNAEFRDTVFKLNNLFQDGSYGFEVVAYCGTTEARSEKIDFKPPLSDCPKLNAANIWVNDWNPKGDTIGFEYYSPRQNYVPYMWRYREAGTVIWLDTLISAVHTSLKLTFPKQNRSYEIQLKPVASAACPDNWSDSKKYFVKCLKPTLVSRKVIGTMAEFESNKVNSLYRWRYRLEGESEWKTISTGSEYKLTLSDLKPNSNYELQVQTQCDENEWGDYYTTTFTTKLCFYDSLKMSHDYIYPNQIRLKTNLPQEEILSGRPKFNWSM